MLHRYSTLILAAACLIVGLALWRFGGPTHPIYVPAVIPTSLQRDVAEDSVLQTRINELRLDHVTLDEALCAISDKAKISVVADWHTLEGAGFDRNFLLANVHLHDVTLEQALNGLVRNLGLKDFPNLVFDVEDGIVTVSTNEDLSRVMVTECVNLRPLLEKLHENGYRTFQATDGGRPPALTPEEEVEQLIVLITSNVAPDSWRSAGGNVASIREFNGILVFTHTRHNVRAMRNLLRGLYAASSTSFFPQDPLAVVPTQPSTNGDIHNAPGQKITVYWNIRPLLTAITPVLQTKRPHTKGDDLFGPQPPTAGEAIQAYLINAIDPPSWRDPDGAYRNIDEVGGILVITQTPQNIKATRAALDHLQRAAAQNDFPEIPPPPTTRPG